MPYLAKFQRCTRHTFVQPFPLPYSILQPCVFRTEYALEQAGGREFGSVFINDKENLSLAVVGAGMAKVRPAGGQQSPFYDDLVKAQESAESRGVGIFTKNRDAFSAAVRDVAEGTLPFRCFALWSIFLKVTSLQVFPLCRFRCRGLGAAHRQGPPRPRHR